MTPSSNSIHLLEQLTELRGNLLVFTSVSKEMIKDTDRRLDEETEGLRGSRVQQLLSSRSWGASPSRKLFEAHTIGIFMAASSRSHHLLIIPRSAFLPSREDGGERGEKFQPSHHGGSSRGPGPIPEPTHSRLFRTKDAPGALTT